MEKNTLKLASKIRELRKNKNISQAELAKNITVTQSTVARWEIGSSLPNLFEGFRLAKFFEVPIEVFDTDEGEKFSILKRLERIEKILSVENK